jgi:adenylosuccinate synthase
MGYKSINGWGNLKGVHSYSNSPAAFQNYISYLSKELEVPVSLISIGPERNQLLEV